jgi:ribosomal protein S18 acetylase RimI-like enzyme
VQFSLRPASDQDREFLYALHCRTMREVIEKTWGWDEAWQRVDFQRRFHQYVVSIIECDGRAAGGLLLEWTPHSLYIHEIQLLPEYQSKGIGTGVIGRLIEQAAARRLPVTLSVVPANRRAQHLYERLGFEVTAIEPPFIRMRYCGDGL